MVTEKEFLTQIECLSENLGIMFYTSDYQELCINTISLKRYNILNIGYLIKTCIFGLNVAYSNCH